MSILTSPPKEKGRSRCQVDDTLPKVIEVVFVLPSPVESVSKSPNMNLLSIHLTLDLTKKYLFRFEFILNLEIQTQTFQNISYDLLTQTTFGSLKPYCNWRISEVVKEYQTRSSRSPASEGFSSTFTISPLLYPRPLYL